MHEWEIVRHVSIPTRCDEIHQPLHVLCPLRCVMLAYLVHVSIHSSFCLFLVHSTFSLSFLTSNICTNNYKLCSAHKFDTLVIACSVLISNKNLKVFILHGISWLFSMLRKAYMLSGLWIPRYFEVVSYISENAQSYNR